MFHSNVLFISDPQDPHPRVGDLRFRLPVAVDAYNGSLTVTAFGPACPQQEVKLPILSGFPEEVIDYVVNSAFGTIFPSAEDCQ